MSDFVAKKDRNTPEHTQRFDGAGRLGLAHIGCFPPELIKDLGYVFFA